ncbi:MAG: hypothetical protein ABJA10_02495 [Aestuariivirga sp.]
MLKSRFTLVLSLAAVGFSPSAMAINCPVEGLVQDAADAFAAASRSHSASAFANSAARFADMRALALFALGPYRSQLPSGMEGRYISRAKVFMGRFMAQYSGRITNSDLTITNCSPQVVSARMGDSSIVFKLSGNRITDVSVSGFSVAHAMREKFTGIITDKGGDVKALVDYLDQ